MWKGVKRGDVNNTNNSLQEPGLLRCGFSFMYCSSSLFEFETISIQDEDYASVKEQPDLLPLVPLDLSFWLVWQHFHTMRIYLWHSVALGMFHPCCLFSICKRHL